MITPALLIIPLSTSAGGISSAEGQRGLQAVVIASAGLLLALFFICSCSE
jgi:hypothetical protein